MTVEVVSTRSGCGFFSKMTVGDAVSPSSSIGQQVAILATTALRTAVSLVTAEVVVIVSGPIAAMNAIGGMEAGAVGPIVNRALQQMIRNAIA